MGKPRRFARFFAAFAPKEKEQGRGFALRRALRMRCPDASLLRKMT